jgi:hypothetical protein
MQFGDAVQQAGLIELPVFNQIILDFDFSSGKLFGEYLLENDFISKDALDTVIEQQKQRQVSIEQLIEQHLSGSGVLA